MNQLQKRSSPNLQQAEIKLMQSFLKYKGSGLSDFKYLSKDIGQISDQKLNITNMKDEGRREKEGFKPIIPICMSYPPRTITSTSNLSPQDRLERLYNQYLRLFKEHTLINTTFNHVLSEKKIMEDRLKDLEMNQRSETEDKKKRHRRNAEEISRKWVCRYSGCGKSYGSQGSLAQHTKLKHSEYYNSPQYIKAIRQINVLKSDQ